MSMVFRKTLSILILVYLAAFICFFIFSALSFHGIYVKGMEREQTEENQYTYELSLAETKGVLASRAESPGIIQAFKLSWIINRSILLFSEYFIAIHLSGIFLCFSLIYPYVSNPAESNALFINSLGKSVVLMIFLTFVYTGMSEGISVTVRNRLKNQEINSKIAADMFEKGNAVLAKGDFGSADNFFSSYLEIDRDNKLIRNVVAWTEARMMIRKKNTRQNDKEVSTGRDLDYYKQAEQFYSSAHDYFSSFYYAFLASQTGEDSLKKRALRLMARSRDKLSELESQEKDKERHAYFMRKMNALENLRKGDVYSAYYEFKNLKEEYPAEKDVELLFEESRKAAEQNFFFTDELEKIKNIKGVDAILYLVKREDGGIVIVSIDKYIQTEDGRYFFNIEVMELAQNGNLLTHYKVPYGKYTSRGYINLDAIERNRKKMYGPEYLSGEGKREKLSVLREVPRPEEFVPLSSRGLKDSGLSIVSLFKIRGIAEKYGYLRQSIDASIISRIKLPFEFFILSIYAMGLGWFFRIRNKRIPFLSIPLIIVIPFVLHHLVSVFNYSSDQLYMFLLFKTGLIPALSIFVGIQGLLLFIALVVVSENGK